MNLSNLTEAERFALDLDREMHTCIMNGWTEPVAGAYSRNRGRWPADMRPWRPYTGPQRATR